VIGGEEEDERNEGRMGGVAEKHVGTWRHRVTEISAKPKSKAGERVGPGRVGVRFLGRTWLGWIKSFSDKTRS